MLHDADRRISIHAPHAGSDEVTWTSSTPTSSFQSTLPMRGATLMLPVKDTSKLISIHAPHAGSDGWGLHYQTSRTRFQSTLPMRGATFRLNLQTYLARNFNPRSPCGERPIFSCGNVTPSDFNPRSPCGERPFIPVFHDPLLISIHAPHAGSDGKGTKRKSPHL